VVVLAPMRRSVIKAFTAGCAGSAVMPQSRPALTVRRRQWTGLRSTAPAGWTWNMITCPAAGHATFVMTRTPGLILSLTLAGLQVTPRTGHQRLGQCAELRAQQTGLRDATIVRSLVLVEESPCRPPDGT